VGGGDEGMGGETYFKNFLAPSPAQLRKVQRKTKEKTEIASFSPTQHLSDIARSKQ
jgi:hypothetical protein